PRVYSRPLTTLFRSGVQAVAESADGAVAEQARHAGGVRRAHDFLHVGNLVGVLLEHLGGIAVVLPAAAREPSHVGGEVGVVLGGDRKRPRLNYCPTW